MQLCFLTVQYIIVLQGQLSAERDEAAATALDTDVKHVYSSA